MSTYRIGLFLNPQPNDPTLEGFAQAADKAEQMSIDNNGTPVAVWDDQDRTLVLFAGLERFVPE